MRAPLAAWSAASGVQPQIAGEADDIAMLRLMGLEGVGVTLVSPVVVKDELRELCRVPGLTKTSRAITLQRQFHHPLVSALITRSQVVRALDQRKVKRG